MAHDEYKKVGTRFYPMNKVVIATPGFNGQWIYITTGGLGPANQKNNRPKPNCSRKTK